MEESVGSDVRDAADKKKNLIIQSYQPERVVCIASAASLTCVLGVFFVWRFFFMLVVPVCPSWWLS